MRSQLAPVRTPSVGELESISALDAASEPRHRWYFFKEAFSPSVVERAITDAGAREVRVFDPFCGSGTVPLTAHRHGLESAGMEVNPFLAFVARTKLQYCSVRTFEREATLVARAISVEKTSSLEGFSTFTELPTLEKWLFNTPVLRTFESGWDAVAGTSTPARMILRLCLIGAAMDCCNAVKDGKCLRYRSDWTKLEFGVDDFREALERRIDVIRDDLSEWAGNKCTPTIRQGDSRHRPPFTNFDLCVTSPPYLNSFDYTDIYRPELFLGRFITDMVSLRALRHQTVRSHLQAAWKAPQESEFGGHYSDVMRDLTGAAENLWNRKIPRMVQAYFEDMRGVLRNLRQSANQNSSVWIVVSTSSYVGIEIPVDLIIADIASTTGWFLREVSVLRYLDRLSSQQWAELSERKEHGPHLRESVVILDARPRQRV